MSITSPHIRLSKELLVPQTYTMEENVECLSYKKSFLLFSLAFEWSKSWVGEKRGEEEEIIFFISNYALYLAGMYSWSQRDNTAAWHQPPMCFIGLAKPVF